MASKKMNQILAVEKTVKAKREEEFTKHYRNVQKSELTMGLSRTYQPKDDAGEKLPPESKKVQVVVEEVLKQVVQSMKEVFNLTAQKDATNCLALADIVVDGATIAKNVPATHLLWLEKKLLSFADFVDKLPTLSQDTGWQYDAGQGLYRSDTVETLKTKKVEDFKTVAPATKEHPAQVVKVVEDVTVGVWRTTHLSGAIPVARKQQLLERLEKFQRAVKEARETANQVAVVAELSTGLIVEMLFAS